jgi:endo-1,4-beta-xylanase
MNVTRKLFSLLLTVILIIAPTVSSSAEEAPALKDIYADFFLIGNIFSPNEITPGNARFELMKREFNALTAENAMKPENMQLHQGEFTFSIVDRAIEAILDAGIKVHGHTLAWHQQSPDHLNIDVTREEAEQNLAAHINAVAGHYSGRVISWDVLNEVIANEGSDPENWRGMLRPTPWLAAFAQDGSDGSDYIYTAFKLAREAAPDAILYYNDYRTEDPVKSRAIFHMIKELNEQYLAETGGNRPLIEGMGMQGHYYMDIAVSNVEDSIKLYSQLGIELSVTELDISVQGAGRNLTEEQELFQALKYAELFEMFKRHSDVIERITFWGLDDATAWRPLSVLFNGDLSPKMAYFAVADPEGFLEEHGNASGSDDRGLGRAAFGTPVIDGELDDIWLTTEILPVDRLLQAWNTATGFGRVLWDYEYLYVYVTVNDTMLDNSSSENYQKDSVEIFVGETNNRTPYYILGDGQYRISFCGIISGNGLTRERGYLEDVEYAIKIEGATYHIEARIPFREITPEAGTTLGFDLQINDAENGSRRGMAKWFDPTNNSFNNPSGWGEIELVYGGDSPAASNEINDESDIVSGLSADSDSTDSAFPWLPVAVGGGAVIAAGGVMLLLRKRK